MSTTIGQLMEWMARPDPGWDELFAWPPDVFAFTSAVLKRTGAYRYVVSPPKDRSWPPGCAKEGTRREWRTWAYRLSEEWLRTIGSREELPADIERVKRTLESHWSVQIDLLCELDTKFDESAWEACEAVLILHAVSDCACAGFGTPTSPSNTPELQFRADSMLAQTGSLSRLDRVKGIVLPKMRTPQTGLTLRATSLYATWHETEVDIQWRSVPWVNSDENTLNVLALPWPEQVDPVDFMRAEHPWGQRTVGNDRYFEVTSGQPFVADRVLAAHEACLKQVNRVHLIALPELALTYEQLRELKKKLTEFIPHDRMPLLITGVRDQHPDDGGDSSWCNAVVFSAFFAERWYDLWQDKHHRWRLNQKQLRQYQIGGVLASDCHWWEHFRIRRRTLSVLAPSGWLALCPMICEDLAQMDPVSELIRGIGPTLVVALLMDGPQLTHRWSARYASVLADDPGSSVLTITALGMCRQSRPAGSAEADSNVVALWKDGLTGFRPLAIEPGSTGLLITLTAEWKTEHTADGRYDHNTAAVFAFSGVHQIKPNTTPSATHSVAHDSILFGQRLDLLELTTLSQVVDASLDAEPAQRTVILANAGAASDARRTGDIDYALGYFEDLMEDLTNRLSLRANGENTGDEVLCRWSAVFDVVMKELGPDHIKRKAPAERGSKLRVIDKSRTDYAVLQAVLWSIQNRLQARRQAGSLDREGTGLLTRVLDAIHRPPPILSDPDSVPG